MRNINGLSWGYQVDSLVCCSKVNNKNIKRVGRRASGCGIWKLLGYLDGSDNLAPSGPAHKEVIDVLPLTHGLQSPSRRRKAVEVDAVVLQ